MRSMPRLADRATGAWTGGLRLALLGAAVLSAWLPAAACYSFSGGGGLPTHVRSAYVEPVRNETPRFGISEQLTERLLEAARGRLGLRLAPEDDADAFIRATLTRYDDDAVNFEAEEGTGADVFQRRVTIAARVEILDLGRREVLWSSSSVTGQGEYRPDTESEEEGVEVALENLVQKIVDGAQSQW